jgi:hypothetical protein
VAKIRRGVTPARKFEPEPVFEEPPWYDAAALENELAFSTHERRSDLEHPLRARHTERYTVRVTKHSHEVGIRQWVWRCDVHDAVDLMPLNQPAHGREEILVVNPRNKLSAISGGSAETVSNESEKRIEHASWVRAHRHRRSKRNLSGPTERHLVKGALPRPRNVDAVLIAVGVLYTWLALFPMRRRESWAWWTLAFSSLIGFLRARNRPGTTTA